MMHNRYTLGAIKTEYGGHHYLSRTEARWAVFFDVAGIKHEHEAQGYDLSDGRRYLPDFLLNELGFFVEVKPSGWNIDDSPCGLLPCATNAPCLVLCGPPASCTEAWIYKAESGPSVKTAIVFTECDDCQQVIILENRNEGMLRPLAEPSLSSGSAFARKDSQCPYCKSRAISAIHTDGGSNINSTFRDGWKLETAMRVAALARFDTPEDRQRKEPLPTLSTASPRWLLWAARYIIGELTLDMNDHGNRWQAWALLDVVSTLSHMYWHTTQADPCGGPIVSLHHKENARKSFQQYLQSHRGLQLDAPPKKAITAE